MTDALRAPSLTYDEARDRADRVVRQGELGSWLLPLTIIVIALIIGPATYGPHHWMLGMSIAGTIAAATYIAFVWNWWRWAITQDVDLYLVEEMAEERHIIFGHRTPIGRLERRLWLKLPAGYREAGPYRLPPVDAATEDVDESELDQYLAEYFHTREQFAAVAEHSVAEIDALVRGELIPAPSYVVADGVIRSFVFGTMPAPDAAPAEYFHPANIVWVNVAVALISEAGRAAAPAAMRTRFAAEWRLALAEQNRTTWRLADAFDDSGAPIEAGLSKRTDSAWTHFLRGTYGLCVLNPLSVAAIVEKEILQEKLSSLSDDGARRRFADTEGRELRAVIDAYDAVAMPFSPVDYEVSSRKRLVDDLRKKLGAGS